MEDSTRQAGVDLERDGEGWETWRTIVHALLHLDPFMDVEEIDRFEPLQDEIDLDAVRWRSFITEVASGCGLDIRGGRRARGPHARRARAVPDAACREAS